MRLDPPPPSPPAFTCCCRRWRLHLLPRAADRALVQTLHPHNLSSAPIVVHRPDGGRRPSRGGAVPRRASLALQRGPGWCCCCSCCCGCLTPVCIETRRISNPPSAAYMDASSPSQQSRHRPSRSSPQPGGAWSPPGSCPTPTTLWPSARSPARCLPTRVNGAPTAERTSTRRARRSASSRMGLRPGPAPGSKWCRAMHCPRQRCPTADGAGEPGFHCMLDISGNVDQMGGGRGGGGGPGEGDRGGTGRGRVVKAGRAVACRPGLAALMPSPCHATPNPAHATHSRLQVADLSGRRHCLRVRACGCALVCAPTEQRVLVSRCRLCQCQCHSHNCCHSLGRCCSVPAVL